MVPDMLNHFLDYEIQMIKEDINEISRQEAKNMLEEQLYKYRAAINENSEGIEEEEAFKNIKDYFEQTENWLYEEGEDAPEQTCKEGSTHNNNKEVLGIHSPAATTQEYHDRYPWCMRGRDHTQKTGINQTMGIHDLHIKTIFSPSTAGHRCLSELRGATQEDHNCQKILFPVLESHLSSMTLCSGGRQLR